jgi:hypothetical protein
MTDEFDPQKDTYVLVKIIAMKLAMVYIDDH